MRGHRFASNDEAVAYMKRVAVDASGFTAFLGVEPLLVPGSDCPRL